jgi:hypothetical protein
MEATRMEATTSNGKDKTMRLLGIDGSLGMFKWDFVYLLAQLTTDERPGIPALAGPIESAMNDVEVRRGALEQAQSTAVMTTALVAKRDKGRDRLIIKMGGVARATDRDVYERLFPKLSPSQTTKLGTDAETTEVTRILAELKGLEATHPVRTAYESSLTDAQAAVALAKSQADAAEIALTLERSHVTRSKQEWDKLRLETHGKLVALLGDKTEAEAFFRPAVSSPEEKNEAPVETANG